MDKNHLGSLGRGKGKNRIEVVSRPLVQCDETAKLPT